MSFKFSLLITVENEIVPESGILMEAVSHPAGASKLVLPVQGDPSGPSSSSVSSENTTQPAGSRRSGAEQAPANLNPTDVTAIGSGNLPSPSKRNTSGGVKSFFSALICCRTV